VLTSNRSNSLERSQNLEVYSKQLQRKALTAKPKLLPPHELREIVAKRQDLGNARSVLQ
jgi:hypothetical protein